MYTMNQWTLIGFTGQDAENSLHAKRKARNHAVGRHQRILEERGGCLAEPFGMAPGGPYVELTGFSSRLFLLKPVAGG